MLANSGDWQTIIEIYQDAKLAKNYPRWPYRSILENRINNAEKNVHLFNQPIDKATKDKLVLFNSSWLVISRQHELIKICKIYGGFYAFG